MASRLYTVLQDGMQPFSFVQLAGRSLGKSLKITSAKIFWLVIGGDIKTLR
jgi:hypothetical protein